MGGQNGSLNTLGFQNSIMNNIMPGHTHITFPGTFNSTFFSVGKKANNLIDLYSSYASSNFYMSNAKLTQSNDQFLGLFLKSNKDGQQRDGKPMQAVILLDVSGSMGSQLSPDSSTNRLQLAKTTLKLFFEKLRKNDWFSLIIFDHEFSTILPLTLVEKIDSIKLKDQIDKLQPRGGNYLISAFESALNDFSKVSTEQQIIKRIIIITDAWDDTIITNENLIEISANKQIYTTFIGVSGEFNSKVCEDLIDIEGFNYFCALEDQDLMKHVVDNFDYTFFPFAYNFEIILECDGIEDIEVFGTSDAEKVKSYQKSDLIMKNQFVISRIKSIFPSSIQADDENNIQMEGGLILIKFKLKPNQEEIKGQFLLKCNSPDGSLFENSQYFQFQISNNQFFNCSAMFTGVNLFYYVDIIKQVLQNQEQSKAQPTESVQEDIKKIEQLAIMLPEDFKAEKEIIQKLLDILNKKHKIPK